MECTYLVNTTIHHHKSSTWDISYTYHTYRLWCTLKKKLAFGGVCLMSNYGYEDTKKVYRTAVLGNVEDNIFNKTVYSQGPHRTGKLV
jgi:hypothetical protein